MSRREVLHSLILARRDAVHRFLRRRVRESQAVPDLVQEVFLRLLQAGDRRNVANPDAYLFAIAANLVREHAAGARADMVRRVDLSDPIVAEALIEEPGLDAEMTRAALVSRLREALLELPQLTQTIIRMAYVEERSYREVARELGVSKMVVEWRILKAIDHCTQRLVGQDRRKP
jgi:RNA polymerase sigma-70 factor (ECF subfamily)